MPPRPQDDVRRIAHTRSLLPRARRRRRLRQQRTARPDPMATTHPQGPCVGCVCVQGRTSVNPIEGRRVKSSKPMNDHGSGVAPATGELHTSFRSEPLSESSRVTHVKARAIFLYGTRHTRTTKDSEFEMSPHQMTRLLPKLATCLNFSIGAALLIETAGRREGACFWDGARVREGSYGWGGDWGVPVYPITRSASRSMIDTA